jgi:hypothetical protein
LIKIDAIYKKVAIIVVCREGFVLFPLGGFVSPYRDLIWYGQEGLPAWQAHQGKSKEDGKAIAHSPNQNDVIRNGVIKKDIVHSTLVGIQIATESHNRKETQANPNRAIQNKFQALSSRLDKRAMYAHSTL